LPRTVTDASGDGLVKDVIVAPHFDILPERMVFGSGRRRAGRPSFACIDEDTRARAARWTGT